jgi:hypothetical protein
MTSTRRSLLLGAAASALVAPMASRAASQCMPTPRGRRCIVGVQSDVLDSQLLQNAPATRQLRSQWCWAACISMVFAYHGHPVHQQRIVERMMGAPVDRPGAGWQITQALGGIWEDERGSRFRSSARVLDLQSGQFEVHNGHLIAELADDRPFVAGAAGHATLATAMEFTETPYGPHVHAVTVRDPWPYSPPRRSLAPHEMMPMYLATVRVRS